AGLRPQGLRGRLTVIDPLFLLEAVVNGVLLGGVLALLSLGLNLIFGVIDIVWIAYVDLVMLCMYAVYFMYTVYHWNIWVAGVTSVMAGGGLGGALPPPILSPLPSRPPPHPPLPPRRVVLFPPLSLP